MTFKDKTFENSYMQIVDKNNKNDKNGIDKSNLAIGIKLDDDTLINYWDSDFNFNQISLGDAKKLVSDPEIYKILLAVSDCPEFTEILQLVKKNYN